MSYPKQVLRDAEELSVSFLSSKTSAVLDHALGNTALSAPERQTLGDAATFLDQIADGAQIATTATVREGVSPSRSIAALDMALGPMAALKNIVRQDEQLDAFFGSLATAVRTLGQTGAIADAEQIRTAKTFFEALRTWLADELSASRAKIGDRTARFA